MLPDIEADIDEHVMLTQSKTDVVFDTVGGEVTVDLSEIHNAVREEDKEDENESTDMDPTRDDLRKSWFRKFEKTKEITYKESVDVSGTKKLKKDIIN